MLTQKQHNLLLFIVQYQNDNNGVSPSYDEMKDGLRLKSKSGIHRLVSALEERGFIRRLAFRARAIEILHTRIDENPKIDLGIEGAAFQLLMEVCNTQGVGDKLGPNLKMMIENLVDHKHRNRIAS